MATDLVNSPPHYALPDGSQAIDHIQAALTPDEFRGYLRGNALKYLLRAEKKGGATDYAKGVWYLNKLKDANAQGH
jgi:hypothetical protein